MQVLDRVVRRLPKLVFLSSGHSPQAPAMHSGLIGMLAEVNTAAEALSEALDAEVEAGENAYATFDASESARALARWQQCRNQTEQRQELYYQSVSRYRQRVASLPRPLRATATELGLRAMKVRSA